MAADRGGKFGEPTAGPEEASSIRQPGSPIHSAAFRSLTLPQLEERWRVLLDMADENDDDGGHVGISRYHREQSRLIGEEIRKRKVAEADV